MIAHPLISLLLSFLSFNFPNIYIYMMNHFFLRLCFFFLFLFLFFTYLFNNCVLCLNTDNEEEKTDTHKHTQEEVLEKELLLSFAWQSFPILVESTIYVCTDLFCTMLHCCESCNF